MKKYRVYFTDFPSQFMVCKAKSVREATQLGKQYIKSWNLNADILKIEEDKKVKDEEDSNSGQE